MGLAEGWRSDSVELAHGGDSLYPDGMQGAPSRLALAIAAFRRENARDPNHLLDGGTPQPKELLDADRLAAWVERLEPNASEALRLASHCQHLRRWEMPRSDFEAGRIGYLKWRKTLGRFHAERAAEVLRGLGYDDGVLEAVRQINLKQGLQANADAQTMEDALCLSFLEHELAEFAEKHPEDKVVDIIQKTWAKMSDRGHRAALALELTAPAGELVKKALTPAA